MNNLIVGIATNYTWEDLEPFVISLRRSGYSDRCILIFEGSVDESLQTKVAEYQIEIRVVPKTSSHPIVSRFTIIADIIDAIFDLDYVICVDTKDIVFQSNPIAWLEQNLGDKSLAIVSEGSLYINNSGNKKNAIDAFGEDVYKTIANEEVCNAGVIAGRPSIVSRLSRDIYSLCAVDLRLKEFTPTYEDMLPDQTAMNLLIRQYPYIDKVSIIPASKGFVFEGVFDKVHKQQDESRIESGIAYPKNSLAPFVIFHQYFAWLEEVRDIYKE